jgi:hypothetical protein
MGRENNTRNTVATESRRLRRAWEPMTVARVGRFDEILRGSKRAGNDGGTGFKNA